jgi:V/A-type H+-transporting ATPase subunit D
MAKIKHTKNELKTQRDALRRFQRYLPTLQLKKQQLQIEMRQLEHRIREKGHEILALQTELDAWQRLYAEPFDFDRHLLLDAVRESTGNIAGVSIPVLEEVRFTRTTPDLFATPLWVDDGLRTLEKLIRLWVEMHILRKQHRRLADELRVTTQRVNLFEKVKIPESRENIRVIRIFLGDQQTAEVARAKLAKSKSVKE